MSKPIDHEWAVSLVGKLSALWPLDRPLDIVFAPADHAVWAMHDGVADGACNIRREAITIYLRDHADGTEYWRDVLTHEYTHGALAALSDLIATKVPVGAAEYGNSALVQQIETIVARVAGLLDWAARSGVATRVNE